MWWSKDSHFRNMLWGPVRWIKIQRASLELCLRRCLTLRYKPRAWWLTGSCGHGVLHERCSRGSAFSLRLSPQSPRFHGSLSLFGAFSLMFFPSMASTDALTSFWWSLEWSLCFSYRFLVIYTFTWHSCG